MKPARFVYERPATLETAVLLLQQYGGSAKLLAGGQSLLPILNMRLSRPAALIDLSGIPGLDGIRLEGDALVIGALTSHRTVETSPLIVRHCPLLTETVKHVGHLAIRTRGTFGGSIAHADPAAELPAVAAALDGSFRVFGPSGWRTIHWQDFFLTYMTTSLDANEILVEARIPLNPERAGYSFVEVARRHGDFALVGVAALVSLDETGQLRTVRLSLTGVSGTPLRLFDLEQSLVGRVPSEEMLAAAGRIASTMIDPDSDLHASSHYRKDLALTLVTRALALAITRATRADEEVTA